jgi:hypothetical protein
VEGEYGNEPIEDENDDAYYDEQEQMSQMELEALINEVLKLTE